MHEAGVGPSGGGYGCVSPQRKSPQEEKGSWY